MPFKALDSVVDALSQYLKLACRYWRCGHSFRTTSAPLVRVFPVLREAEAVATAPRLAALVPDPQELRA